MSWFEDWNAIEAVASNDDPVERALGRARPGVCEPLERVLGRHGDLTADEAEAFLGAEGDDLIATCVPPTRSGRRGSSATTSPTSSTATSTSRTSAS
jgi:hypothetical protein